LISVIGSDYFVSFNRLPWLKEAKLSDIMNVSMLGKNAITWSNLGIDLEVESLKFPEKYPLIIKRTPHETFVQS
jgi:hypothetical protein